jgi:hypothetical protein
MTITNSKRYGLCLVLGIGLFGAGCGGSGDDDVGDADGGGDGPASAEDIQRCHDSCDQQKFFDCYDASLHATCYASCGEASSSQIATFVGCVENSVCDAECALEIQPEAPPSGDECVSACEAYVASGCELPIDCDTGCAALDPAERIGALYCLSQREGCELPEECAAYGGGSGADPVAECKGACDDLAFFECIQASDQANCRDLCGTVEEDTRDDFTACVAAAGICEDDSCYELLSGEGASADVAGCQRACDDLQFFDCIDAATQSICRDKCTESSADAVEAFKACADLTCDPTCIGTFLESP